MLGPLIGSRSKEGVLLFLFVNEQGYAHEMSLALGLTLSSVQHALSSLAEGGVVVPSKEGKRKVFRFNRTYPLIEELDALLQKAYARMSIEKKRQFYTFRLAQGSSSSKNHLLKVWKQLKEVSSVKLHAEDHTKKWSASGHGKVTVTHRGSVIELEESGSWEQGQAYWNAFRFTLLQPEGLIALEHLRFGVEHPVFLFHLQPIREGILESVDPFTGGVDTYFGILRFNRLFLQLQLRTIGPTKNEKIDSIYS